ncbi:uncharacterized protein CEXT_74801 [Caerostris extrusa]|uniref:Uncharacterized protein n=1 Tax=Caerostris extrusa TaxID=172846 RepID=A0AAV4S7U5_CAEEX|nr:uncharacterized protein CEXT_74801 [Caerostris extrusa]
MSRSSSPEMFGKRFKERARSDPWISDRIRRYFSRRFTVGTNAPSGQQTFSLVEEQNGKIDSNKLNGRTSEDNLFRNLTKTPKLVLIIHDNYKYRSEWGFSEM